MSEDKRLDIPAPGSPNFEARIRETLQVYMGLRGDPLDKGLTLRDLTDIGLLEYGGGRGPNTTIRPGRVYPNIPTEDQTEDLTPPPTPTGFALDAGITNVFITHDAPTYTQGRGHDRTIVYGAKRNSGDPLPTFAQATRIADFIGEVYGYPTDPATIWHMWITWRTRDGVESVTPAGGINGLQVRTGEDVQRLLDALNGQITGSELNTELSQVIDDSMAGVKYLATQYGMRVQVAADGKKLIGGYGLMGTNSAERGPSIDFGVLANRFYVGAPSTDGAISSTRPFIVQTTPTTINGVEVPAGVYIEDGFIKNGTITNAKIANAAIDDAKIKDLSADKIKAGSIAVGQYIQSSTYNPTNTKGWRITGDGLADFREVVVRGGVFANYGAISGIAIDQDGLRTAPYGVGPGFYLGNDGRFSLGSALTWSGTKLNIQGDATFSGALAAATGTFKGELSAATGTFKGELSAATGTFKGSLQAASGSFSGTLTADAINAVSTVNIAGNAVSTMFTDTGNRSATIVVNVPEGEVWEAQLLASWQGLQSATYWATGSDEPRYEITGGVPWSLFSIVTPSSNDGYSNFPIPSLSRSSRVTLSPGANTLSCSLYFPGGEPRVETTLIAFVRKR
jgi:hypothetical protein